MSYVNTIPFYMRDLSILSNVGFLIPAEIPGAMSKCFITPETMFEGHLIKRDERNEGEWHGLEL